MFGVAALVWFFCLLAMKGALHDWCFFASSVFNGVYRLYVCVLSMDAARSHRCLHNATHSSQPNMFIALQYRLVQMFGCAPSCRRANMRPPGGFFGVPALRSLFTPNGVTRYASSWRVSAATAYALCRVCQSRMPRPSLLVLLQGTRPICPETCLHMSRRAWCAAVMCHSFCGGMDTVLSRSCVMRLPPLKAM